MCYSVFTMWGTFQIIPEYKNADGAEVTPAQIKAEAEAAAAHSVRAARSMYLRHKREIIARPRVVRIYTEEDGAREFGCIYGALRYIHERKIKYLFSQNGTADFSYFDYVLLTDRQRWRRAEDKKKIAEENGGHYKKITGWKFDELSGEQGQRYVLKIWDVYPDARGRMVTRGAALFDFSNFFRGDVAALARDFGIEQGADDLKTLYECIEKFSGTLEAITGEKFLTPGKPSAMTIGGIAKRALIREMYPTCEDYRAGLKKFKTEHPISRATDKYFSNTYLMRGGTCYINPDFKRKIICAPVFKIDRNSSYTREAADMPDLSGEIQEITLQEFFNPSPEYEYLCTVEGLKMHCKKGMPALFFDPVTRQNRRFISISEKISFFKQELDKISELYEIEYIHISAAFHISKRENAGFRRYAEKMYKGKNDAKAKSEPALYAVFKALNVNAWGKLAQRADFPTVEHRVEKSTGAIITITRPCREEDEKPAMSIILGAYITMRARLALWETMLKCGGAEPLKVLLYGDSDSVHALQPPPESVAIGTGCGEWKDESGKNGAVYSFYADRKAYFNVLSETPFEVVEHVRGIPSKSIKELRERIAAEKQYTQPDAETYLFRANAAFLVPISTTLKGGRAVLYIPQRLSTAGKIRTAEDRRLIYTGKGFLEI